jgi:hypothetical protein
MSLHGGKVAQIRTKVRHGHCAPGCEVAGEGSSRCVGRGRGEEEPEPEAEVEVEVEGVRRGKRT